MSSSNEPQLPNWSVELLRLTVFRRQELAETASQSWEQLLGEPPETRVEEPRTRHRQEVGVQDGWKITLLADPTRQDLLASSPDIPGPSALVTLGTFVEARDRFLGLTETLLAATPDPVRLAFGAILLKQTPDRVTGYRELVQFLPAVRIDAEGSSALLYRINRPRMSRHSGALQLNRVSSWSVVEVRAMHVALGANAPAPVQSSLATAVRLELDLSTDAAREQSLPEPPCLVRELAELASEIAEKGDIP